MAETEFSVDGERIGKIRLDPLQMSAEGGLDYPQLRVQAEISLQSIEPRRGINQAEPSPTLHDYTLIQMSGPVFFQRSNGGMAQIAEFHSGPMLHFSRDGTRYYSWAIPLDPYRVRRIEEQRAQDMTFQFNITALFAQHPPAPRNQRDTSTAALRTTWLQFQGIKVPQSHWISLLPQLGYGQIHLVEVPVPNKILPNTFTKALAELDQAQSYMNEGDYDKVVGHCRSALETVTSVLPLKFDPGAKPSFADRVDKLLEHFAGVLSDRKQSGLAQICKALWSVGSIPEHPHLPGYFNRTDAEFLLITTTAVLAYVGKLLSSR